MAVLFGMQMVLSGIGYARNNPIPVMGNYSYGGLVEVFHGKLVIGMGLFTIGLGFWAYSRHQWRVVDPE